MIQYLAANGQFVSSVIGCTPNLDPNPTDHLKKGRTEWRRKNVLLWSHSSIYYYHTRTVGCIICLIVTLKHSNTQTLKSSLQYSTILLNSSSSCSHHLFLYINQHGKEEVQDRKAKAKKGQVID